MQVEYLNLLSFNFFDHQREQVETCGLIPKIIDLLKIPNFRFMAITLLYIVTLDDKIRFTCAYSDCLGLVINIFIFLKFFAFYYFLLFRS